MSKEIAARDMAHEIVNTEDVDITHEIVDAWPAWKVYEWLEFWDLTWDGESWVEAEAEDTDAPGHPDDPDAFQEQLAAAMQYAVEHHGKQSHNGQPYLVWLTRTAAKCTTPAAIVAAWLRDALAQFPTHAERHAEDLELLETFHPDVVAAVVAFTRQTGQGVDAYLEQIKANPVALEVWQAGQ